jgi:ABC-type multidrug transport system permease subunit
MTSVQTSAASLRTTMSGKFNSTTDKISNVTLKIFEFDQSLSKIKTELDLSMNTKTVLSQKVSSIRYDLSIMLRRLILVKALVQDNIDTLSGIAVKDARNIVSPVSTQIVPITDDNKKHVNYLFPALLILIIMFISMLLSSLNIVLEKNSRAYFRNFVTPTSDIVFIISSYFTNLFVLLAQLIIVFGVTYFTLDKGILVNFGPTCLILFMTASFFIFLGMVIGYMFSSEEGTILGTISISSVFFFVSNLVIPIDALPETVKFFVNLNPFVIASSLLKRAFLFHIPIEILKPDLILFSIYIVVTLLVLFVMQRITKLKFFYHNVQKNKKIEIAVENKDAKVIHKKQ